MGQTKKHNFHEMLDVFCFQSHNLESRRAYEVESLHVISQSPLLSVCQTLSKSNNFQVKRASEEKSGHAKKFKKSFYIALSHNTDKNPQASKNIHRRHS